MNICSRMLTMLRGIVLYQISKTKVMNEFLEQLVRVWQMPTAEVKRCLVSVYHLAPQISEAFLVFLVAGEQMLIKRHPWFIWLIMLCLSPYQRVFYALASWCPSQRTRDNSKRRGLIACVLKWATSTASFWAQIILDPYFGPSLWPFCSSVQGGYSRIWCSNVCMTARFPRMLQKL